MVAYESNRAVGLETNEMARVIQAKTSEMSEDFAELKSSFSMAKLGIYHCQPIRTRAKPNASLP